MILELAKKQGSLEFSDCKKSIPDNAPVTITPMGHVIEVQYIEHINRKMPIKVIDKDHYQLLVGDFAGEIREFEHSENKAGSFVSLKKTFKKLRYLINNNFTGSDNELFVTLTYAENMTDLERLRVDFKLFIKKLRYKYKGIHNFDYINVVEPQGRGAWHCHVLLKSDIYLYIPNSTISELWGQGFTNTRRISSVDNVGAYLTAYLADVEITPEFDLETVLKCCGSSGGMVEKEVEVNGEKIKKQFLKGGRLPLYPSGKNLFRKSKGIVYPDRYFCFWDDDTKKAVVGSRKPVYSKGLVMSDDEKDFTNCLIYEQYNLNRP